MAKDPKVEAAKEAKEAKRLADIRERGYDIELKTAKREEAAQAKREEQDTKRHTDLESIAADNRRFTEEQFKSAKKAEARDIVNKGKILKSTKESIAQEQKVQKEVLAKIVADIKLTVPEDQQAEKIKELTGAVESISGGDTQAGIQKVAEQFGDVLGKNTAEALGKMGKEGGKGDDKVAKLKAKEAKQDEMKKKFSFKENVDKVKAFSASAFESIKGLILKGALFAIIMLLPKFLNSQLFQDILAAIKGDFSGLKQQFFDNFGKVIAGLTALFTIFFPGTMFFIIKSISGILINFAKGGFLKIIKGLGMLFKLMKFTFLKVIIAPIAALFKGLVFVLTKVVGAAFAPILGVVLLVVAAFFAIKFFLEKLRDGLNVSSVSDVIKIGLGYLKDALATLGNLFIDLALFILNLSKPLLKFLGVDVESLEGMVEGKRMSTNNGQVATEKAQMNKRIADAKKEATAAEEAKMQAGSGGGAVMANNNNTTNVDQSSTTQVMPTEMPDMTQFANYGEVQLA